MWPTMASTYQDVLVDALRDALDRDRPPPTTPTVPDDVKSVAVQTLADENDNRESCDSGTGPTVAAPRVCPACRRAPASWRACGECQRICADGGSSNGDDDDELPPSRTLAKCLLRSKSRCLFRTWRSGVRSCAKERRDVMKATTHRVGVIFRTWRQAKRSIRAAEHAELKAVTHHRKRTLKSLLAAWRRFNQTAFYVNHRLRSRHQTKVTDGALARYVRVRNLAPAWRAWWIFHVQCATARDCINHLGEANSREFFLRSAVFGKWRMSTHLTRRERTERAAAAVDAKADEVLRREQALESTTSDIIGEHVEKINVQLRRALTNEADLAKKLASMERELREKDAVIEGNARSMKSTLENAEDFEATLARRAVEVSRADRESNEREHEREVAWLRAAVERAFEECLWYRTRYGAVDANDDLPKFLARIAGEDRARGMLPVGTRPPWVSSFAPEKDQLATRLGGPKARTPARMMGGVPRVPRHGRWGGAHPTHPVTAPWYPSSTLRNGGRDGTNKRGDTFPGFGKAVSSRSRLRASDRAWEAHRAGFALASTAADARAAASLAITQGDTVDGQSMTADRVEYNYTVEIPPSTAKKAPPEPMRPIREKVERWNDEVDGMDDVSVRSERERERAASVISVAASMLDFDDSDGDDGDGRRSGYSDDSDDDLFSQAPSVRSAPRSAVPTAAAAKGGDDSDDDDWMFRGKGVKA